MFLGFLGLSISCDKDVNSKPSYLQQDMSEHNNGLTCIELQPTIKWVCEDPDNDPLVYELYFGEAPDKLELIAENIRSTSYKLKSTLLPETKYYFQVKVSDGHNELSSDIFEFTTMKAAEVSGVPSTPIIISPQENVLHPGDVTFSWHSVKDDKGVENIKYILQINYSHVEVGKKTQFTKDLKEGEYFWHVTAVDKDGNSSQSRIISFYVRKK